MTGRRRDARFLLSAPLEGHLHLREEVSIERWDHGEIEATSPVPASPDERLALELPGDDDRRLAVTVRDSRPMVEADGSIRYRLLMSYDPSLLSGDLGKGQGES